MDFDMRRGMTIMPGENILNDLLRDRGLRANIMVVNQLSGLQFFRQHKPAPDSLFDNDALQEYRLKQSVDKIAQYLGVGAGQNKVPLITGMNHTRRPQDLPFEQLVGRTSGAGFSLDTNSHMPGLALVTGPDYNTTLGFITPFMDAPAVFMVYVGENIVTAHVQAIWHRLPAPFGHNDPFGGKKANLLGATIHAMEMMLHDLGEPFRTDKFYAFVSPGANTDFFIDVRSKYGMLMSSHDRNQFVVKRNVDDHLITDPSIGEPVFGGMRLVDELFLQSWVVSLIGRAGVPEDQIFCLPHDTVTNPLYASARSTREVRGSNALVTYLAKL